MNPEAKLSKIVAKLQLPFEPAKLQLEDALEGFLCERFGLYYDVGGGKTLKVKHFSHGVKDKLRHARAVHWRADID